MTDLHLTLMQLLALAACCAVNLALVAICLAIRFGDPDARPLTALRGQVIPVRSRAGVRRAATLDHPTLNAPIKTPAQIVSAMERRFDPAGGPLSCRPSGAPSLPREAQYGRGAARGAE